MAPAAAQVYCGCRVSSRGKKPSHVFVVLAGQWLVWNEHRYGSQGDSQNHVNYSTWKWCYQSRRYVDSQWGMFLFIALQPHVNWQSESGNPCQFHLDILALRLSITLYDLIIMFNPFCCCGNLDSLRLWLYTEYSLCGFFFFFFVDWSTNLVSI